MPGSTKTSRDVSEEQLIKIILNTEAFKNADILPKLLLYLFERRDRYATSDEIITEVFGLKEGILGADNRVRERTKVLRMKLQDFASTSELPLICLLPEAARGRGYKLEFKARSADAVTLDFWKPHVGNDDVYIVYVEQLFYQDWPRRFLFRHPELNAESEPEALLQLKTKYPAEFHDGLNVAYPYVAYQEIGARDRLLQWFAEIAYTTVKTAVTRRLDDAVVWASSLILLGEERSNPIMRDVLKICAPLDIKIEVLEEGGLSVGRVRIEHPVDDEITNAVRLGAERLSDSLVIPYDPSSGRVMTVLTRVRNRRSGKIVTMFCSEFAPSIEQLALLFTDDQMLQEILRKVGWENKLPPQFQILFMFEIDSIATAHRVMNPEILAWRAYTE